MSIEDTLQEEITSELSRRKYVNNDEGKAQMAGSRVKANLSRNKIAKRLKK